MKKKTTLSLFFRLAIREIKKNWTQFLAIISIGAIAVTLFVGLEANSVSLTSRVNQTYDEGNMADLWVTSSRYDKRDEKKIVSLLAKEDSYEKRFELSATAGTHSLVTAVSKKIPTISKPFDLDANEKQSETYFCIIDEAISKKSDGIDTSGFYGIGEKLSVVYDLSSYGEVFSSLSSAFGFDEYFENASNPFKNSKWTLSFVVTGTMKYPENISKASYGTSTTLISSSMFVSSLKNEFSSRFKDSLSESERGTALKKMASIFEELGYLEENDGVYDMAPNQYVLKIPSKSRLDYVEKALSERSKKDGATIISVNTRENMPFFLTITNEIAQAEGFTYLFPFVFFFVAILIVLVTASQMILKERSQIGTLKALGVKKRGIILFYVAMVCSLVLLGIIIGEILGPIIVPVLMGNKYSLIYTLPKLTYVFPVLKGLLSALAFLGVSALTSYLVVRKEVSLQPSESMRPATPSFKSRFKDKKKSGRESSLFLSIKMAFRNIRANLVKSIMVIAGVMGCTALLLTGYGIEDTVNYGIAHDLDKVSNCDFTMTFSESKKEEEFANDVKGVSNIDKFEMYSSLTTKAVSSDSLSTNTTVYVLSDSTNTHFAFAEGMKKDEVCVSEKLQETLNLKVGDEITFSIGNVNHGCKIAFFYKAFVYSGIAIYGDNEIFEGKTLTYNGAYLDLLDESKTEETREELKTALPYLLSIQSKQDWRDKVNNILQGILVMTGAVKVFAILLALVVLYNLALLNFNERSRDIATLKVLGFNLWEIILSLLVETMALTLFGVIFGLALGYPFMLAVMGLNKVELVTYLYHIEPLSYVLSFIMTFVVAFFVNLFFGFRSKKIKMVESLKSVE